MISLLPQKRIILHWLNPLAVPRLSKLVVRVLDLPVDPGDNNPFRNPILKVILILFLFSSYPVAAIHPVLFFCSVTFLIPVPMLLG